MISVQNIVFIQEIWFSFVAKFGSALSHGQELFSKAVANRATIR